MTRPATKLAYLLLLAVGLFFLREVWALAALALLQLALWKKSDLDFSALLRIGRRLAFFFTILTLSYAFFPTSKSGAEDRWVPLLFAAEVNLTGLGLALTMALRVTALLLASSWVQRSGEPGDFVKGLRTLRLPRSLAFSIDATLSMLTASGGGGGGGRRRKKQAGGKVIDFAEIRRGDLSFVRKLLRGSIDRATDRVSGEHKDLSATLARDLAIVSGIALAAMGLKALQVMPGLPVAPGHKNVLLLPFFLFAARNTHSRFGGLWVGTTIGLISFFSGHGKYGILELLHYIVPGLLADLMAPVLHGRGGWRLLQLMVMGAIMGAGRFAANFAIILLTGGKFELFLVYSPMLVSQVVFGVLSGFVSLVLVGQDDWLEEEAPAAGPDGGPGPGSGSGGGGGGGGRGRRGSSDVPAVGRALDL
ncbi:MAG: hypothetical protein GY711_14605 [bacterium]|nr:hypothetical protein [bacterium]